MRLADPRRAILRNLALRAFRPPDHLGRLSRNGPRPWSRGWGAIWATPDFRFFAGLASPRGRPDKAWLWAGRWNAPPGSPFRRFSYTFALRFDLAVAALAGVPELVGKLLENAGTDPEIKPPTRKIP